MRQGHHAANRPARGLFKLSLPYHCDGGKTSSAAAADHRAFSGGLVCHYAKLTEPVTTNVLAGDIRLAGAAREAEATPVR